MASGDDAADLSPLGARCLSLSRLLASQGRAFSLKLTIGHHFSFCVDSKGMRSLPAQGLPDGNWTKKMGRVKSPSAIKRDKRRRNDFLRRKEASLSPATSKLDIPTSVTSPCSMGGATLEAATSQEETLGIHDTARKSRSSMGGHNGHDSGSAHGYDKGERSPREAVREGQQMGIKELGRRAKEGLDELMRIQQQRLEEEKNWGFPKPKVSSKGIKCRCCDEIISDVNHTCDTYDSLCEKINQRKINSLTDYQANLLESHMHSSSIFKV